MILFLTAVLVGLSVYLVLYQFRSELFGIEESHLPLRMLERNNLAMELTQDKYTQQPEKSLLTLTRKFKGWEKRVPIPTAGIKRRLVKAGLPMGTLEFLAFKALSLIGVPVIMLLLFGRYLPNKDLVVIISLIAGFFIPDLWLNKKINKRQSAIRKELPIIIDLLNLCVGGGLDFMLAVNRVVRDLKRSDLTSELAEVYRETQMGKSRKEALKNFSWRVDMPEVYSFVRTLVQADRMGTPMAEALNVQAEEMRVRRFQYGESMALKAPIKLLFPLFAFILPVVLIIVGGPIILQFTQGGIQLGF